MAEEKEILEGFNAGYILEQYRPKFTKELISGIKEGNSPFIEGFIAGRDEFIKNRGKIKTLEKFKSLSRLNLREVKKKNKEMDKDI